MTLFEKWFFPPKTVPPRTIGSLEVKRNTVGTELFFLNADEKEYGPAMGIMIGKDWKKIPVPDMMTLVNMRLEGTPIDYSEAEVVPTFQVLKSCVSDLSIDQVRFLKENDHLPRSGNEDAGVWMDGKELQAYEREQGDLVYKKKTDYFIAVNGIIAAHAQALNTQAKDLKVVAKDHKKEFSITTPHIIALTAIIAGIVIYMFL